MKTAQLFMIPCPIVTVEHGENANHTLAPHVISAVHKLQYFVVERARTARRFIKATQHPNTCHHAPSRVQCWASLPAEATRPLSSADLLAESLAGVIAQSSTTPEHVLTRPRTGYSRSTAYIQRIFSSLQISPTHFNIFQHILRKSHPRRK